MFVPMFASAATSFYQASGECAATNGAELTVDTGSYWSQSMYAAFNDNAVENTNLSVTVQIVGDVVYFCKITDFVGGAGNIPYIKCVDNPCRTSASVATTRNYFALYGPNGTSATVNVPVGSATSSPLSISIESSPSFEAGRAVSYMWNDSLDYIGDVTVASAVQPVTVNVNFSMYLEKVVEQLATLFGVEKAFAMKN